MSVHSISCFREAFRARLLATMELPRSPNVAPATENVTFVFLSFTFIFFGCPFSFSDFSVVSLFFWSLIIHIYIYVYLLFISFSLHFSFHYFFCLFCSLFSLLFFDLYFLNLCFSNIFSMFSDVSFSFPVFSFLLCPFFSLTFLNFPLLLIPLPCFSFLCFLFFFTFRSFLPFLVNRKFPNKSLETSFDHESRHLILISWILDSIGFCFACILYTSTSCTGNAAKMTWQPETLRPVYFHIPNDPCPRFWWSWGAHWAEIARPRSFGLAQGEWWCFTNSAENCHCFAAISCNLLYQTISKKEAILDRAQEVWDNQWSGGASVTGPHGSFIGYPLFFFVYLSLSFICIIHFFMVDAVVWSKLCCERWSQHQFKECESGMWCVQKMTESDSESTTDLQWSLKLCLKVPSLEDLPVERAVAKVAKVCGHGHKGHSTLYALVVTVHTFQKK